LYEPATEENTTTTVPARCDKFALKYFSTLVPHCRRGGLAGLQLACPEGREAGRFGSELFSFLRAGALRRFFYMLVLYDAIII
jgi:hypothetical protein